MELLSNQPFVATGDRYPEHICLFLHGLGGGLYELQPLIQAVQQGGFSTCGILYPGHDRRVKKMPASRWQDWYDHIQNTFQDLQTKYRKVTLIGFSTGCPLGLKLTQELKNQNIESLVLISPYLKIKRYPLVPPPEWLVYSLGYVVKDIPRLNLPVKDKEMLKLMKASAPMKSFNMASVRSANELIQQVKPKLAQVKAPTLIVQSKKDSVVDPSGAQYLYENLGSPAKTLHWMSASDHTISLDYERETLQQLTLSFLGSLETSGDRHC